MSKVKQGIAKILKSDGWTNLWTWLGMKGKDRTAANVFRSECILGEETLLSIYRSNGIGKRIVDLPANEMIRQWFHIEGDSDNKICAKLDTLDAKNKILELTKWARLLGGAIAVMGIDDGNTFDKPLNESNIRSVKFITIYDRFQITFSAPNDLYKDTNQSNFGEVEYYTIMPRSGGMPFRVHASRVLKMTGTVLPNRLFIENQRWGDSILQACYTELSHLGSAYLASANILQDFIQTILKVPGLSGMIANDQEDQIKQRLEIIDTSRSVANTIIIDAEEAYEKSASSVAGLDDLVGCFTKALASVTGIPYALLMGQSPSGLASTGDLEIRMFYDKIKSAQEDELKPVLERLLKLIMLSTRENYKDVESKNWKIIFNPLWQMSELETANYRKVVADTDAIYLDRGVITPDECADSRFGSGNYSAETEIDNSARVDPDPAPEEEVKDYEKDKKLVAKTAQDAIYKSDGTKTGHTHAIITTSSEGTT